MKRGTLFYDIGNSCDELIFPCSNLRKMKFKYDMGQDDMSEDDVYNDWQTGTEVNQINLAAPI